MIDIIGVIAVVAIYALLVGVLFGFSGMDRRVKFVSIAAAVVWAAGIIALAAAGGFAPRAAGPIPAPILTFAGLLLLLLGAWLFLPGFRAGLLIVPLPALVGVNIARLGGVMFLILEAKGRLSAPFAPVAGWGDITVAALAIPLALMARESSRNAIWLSI